MTRREWLALVSTAPFAGLPAFTVEAVADIEAWLDRALGDGAVSR
jgi:hypothetical protein